MNYKLDMLNDGDKDLICEFVYRSVNRVLNKKVVGWDKPVPQGVSVFMAHPDTGEFEYMFTKDEKFNVVKDDQEEIKRYLDAYGSVESGGVVFYLNSCMLKVANKHMRYAY